MRRGMPSRRWVLDAIGIMCVLAAGVAVLTPALVHGPYLGSYDILSLWGGLLAHHAPTVHNLSDGDQIAVWVPWTTLVASQVHHGYLPLWNPYSALGMPLAFNWQSAPFGLPALISYAFPVHLTYTVQVIATLVLAGIGTYLLGRILGLGVIACVMAAVAYELSGPFLALLGWSVISVMACGPWLFAAAFLIVRGRHRLRSILFFALVLAFMIYAGEPEIVLLLGLALAVFLLILLPLNAVRAGGAADAVRSTRDLAVATIAGAGFAAPLLLPGMQIAAHSIRDSNASSALSFHRALPWTSLIGLLFPVERLSFPGIDGVAGSHVTHYPLPATLGVIALVLAAVGIARRHHEPWVIAFGAVAVVTGGLTFIPQLVSAMDRLPKIGGTVWTHALISTALAVAVLAGVGIDVLVQSRKERFAQVILFAGLSVSAILLLALWVFGRGHLPATEAADRSNGFIWPSIETAVGFVVLGVLGFTYRAGRQFQVAVNSAVAALVACQAAFLISSGAPLWASSSTFLPTTPGVAALQRVVGASVVGLGGSETVNNYPETPILPDANSLYGVHEFAVYDPMTPSAYFDNFSLSTGEVAGTPSFSTFAPVVLTAKAARRYGIGFLLAPIGWKAPTGTELVSTVGNQVLYRVPGGAPATLTPLTTDGVWPKADAIGTPVKVTHPSPASWRVVTNKPTPQILRFHLTNLPGWHGSIDGRPLPLHPFSQVMLQARIPPGHHTIELHYWPSAFTTGIILASGTAMGFLLAGIWVSRRNKYAAKLDS